MKTTDVRDRILSTAGRLFYLQGYNSTGINQIIDEAEIARASLYHHFKSKTELLHIYMEELHLSWFNDLNTYIGNIEDTRGKILGIFDFRINRQIRGDFGGCPFIKVSAEIPANDNTAFEIININKTKLRDLILHLLEALPDEKRAINNNELADTLYLLMEGASATSNFQKSKDMLVQAKLIAGKLL